MKLKLDENGHVVVQDGKPVYVHDDGKEVAFDAPQAVQKISTLNSEAKQHREAKEAAEAKLKAFDGIEDAAAAKKALETLKNIDDSKLIDAGKAEQIKAAAVDAVKQQLAAVESEKAAIQQQFHNELVGGSFARSKTIAEKLAIPADVAQAFFGKHFSVEDGKVTAKGADGNPLYSRSRVGEPADFDEALEMLIDAYPHKDSILKGANASGGGGSTNAAGGNVPASYADCKTDADKVAFLKAQNG